MTDYSFIVRVSSLGPGKYNTEVSVEPAGLIASGPAFPDPLQIMGLRSKLAASPSESGLKGLGTLLFKSLFDDDLATLFGQAGTLAQQNGSILHIKLMLEPNELSALPWELLFDPRSQQFLALSANSTFVRYLPTTFRPQRLRVVQLPLRILALFPNPSDMPPIDIEHEIRIMEQTLEPLTQTGHVELIILRHASVSTMLEALRDTPVHILYYQGHVGFNPSTQQSFFLLEDRYGNSFVKGMEQLSWSLDRYDVRLVVINSRGMSGGTLAYTLVSHGLPAVVATQEPMSNEETAGYLKHFFSALADGVPVDASLTQGRLAIANLSPYKGLWASPILVVRQDTSLFSLGGLR